MLGLKASHASWELKGLLLLPGKSLRGGEGLSPEWGQATPLPLLSPPVGLGALLAGASGSGWAEILPALLPPAWRQPRNELCISRDSGVMLGGTSWQGQVLAGRKEDGKISEIDLIFN